MEFPHRSWLINLKILTYPAAVVISFVLGTSSYQPVQTPQTISSIEHPIEISDVQPSSPIRYSGTKLSEETIRMLIKTAPKTSSLSPEKQDEIFNTLKCESKFYPNAEGDYSTTTQKYTSFGLAQIHLPAHPDITETQAKDPVFAVYWMVDQFVQKNEWMWTCWKNIYK